MTEESQERKALSESLEALKHAQNALLDYIPTIEMRGASLNYGRKVLTYVNEAITAAEKALGEKQ